MKLDQDDVTRICQRVVDHGMDTGLVAEQFEVSQRRVQQLAKEYRDFGEVPQLETPGRDRYAEYPDDLEDRILELRQRLGAGAVAIAHVLRVRDGISIANNRVHEILQEYDTWVTTQTNRAANARGFDSNASTPASQSIWTGTRTTVVSRCWPSKTTPPGASST